MEHKLKKWKEFKFRIKYKKEPLYEQPPTWEELINTEGILPTDVFCGWNHGEEEIQPMFSLDDEPIKINYCDLIINRKVEETDEEYLERLKEIEKRKREKEDNEYLEYLRLKAKFEK